MGSAVSNVVASQQEGPASAAKDPYYVEFACSPIVSTY